MKTAKSKLVKTFEQACKLLSIDPKKVLPNVSGVPKQHRDSVTAYTKLVIIAQALNMQENGGKTWKPNWKDSSEWKYYPWFDLSSGSGVRCDGDYVSQYSFSFVGSRLCFISDDLARYAGNKFKKLYEQYFLLR